MEGAVGFGGLCWTDMIAQFHLPLHSRVQELYESRGGRHGLPSLMSLTVSVDVKQHWTVLRHWSQFVPNTSTRRHRT